MGAGHTPGPLHVAACPKHVIDADLDREYFPGGHACVQVRTADGAPLQPTLADLHLHAAAPDLLAALEEARSGLSWPEHAGTFDVIDAALAKARGF